MTRAFGKQHTYIILEPLRTEENNDNRYTSRFRAKREGFSGRRLTKPVRWAAAVALIAAVPAAADTGEQPKRFSPFGVFPMPTPTRGRVSPLRPGRCTMDRGNFGQ